MDPNETLRLIIEALRGDDREDLEEADRLREHLADWLNRGGFQPDWNQCFGPTGAGLFLKSARFYY